MTPLDPAHLTTRMRRMVMPHSIDRHIQHTHHMLAAAALAAMVIVALAGVLIGAIL